MEKKLKEILLSLTSDDLCDWSNARFVARGKLYLSRVEPPVLFPDGELVAEVHGSDDYFAMLRVDKTAMLEAVIAAVGDVRPDIAETIRLCYVRPSRPLVLTW